ncbi:MAG: glucokinase [Xanthomonadales bacterium]|nr:glucokinase [Xanthomonadales bacterium]NIX13012.1 glucokinase [Xanthomonadales bacterium]
MTPPALLIGDIGGTNARFALADPEGKGFSNEMTLACDDFESAGLAIGEYLERAGVQRPEVICLAVAGPVVDDSVRFINNHWSIDCRDLRQDFGTEKAQMFNDFHAISYSIPLLPEGDCVSVGPEAEAPGGRGDYTVGVIGPGTGLGVAGLVSKGGDIHAISGEGGHVGFAPENRLQLQVLGMLRERFERVSNERLLCGPGLENIYRAILRIHGERDVHVEAPEIFRRALANEDVHASESLQLFYEALGQAAGNLVLTMGAWDGVYIAGGILKRYPELLQTGGFRSGFENKGRYRALMERVPTFLILHDQPGLLGAAFLARRMCAP